MTAEETVRAYVAKTGEPLIISTVPFRSVKRWLTAVRLDEVFMDEEPGVYVLLGATHVPDNDDAFAHAALIALRVVRAAVPESALPVGVEFVYFESALDAVRRVEADALGLSLLQLALNESGSQVVIRALL